jgi:DNA-binding response OmpR family regulator
LSKILIIDDEEKIRTLLSRIIELEGFEIFQASDLKNGKKDWKTQILMLSLVM